MVYVQVILPLRLSWEPWYSSETELPAGTRVRVRLSQREYVGVVSGCSALPKIDRARVQGILGVEEALDPIGPDELKFWRFIADYYLCSVGEVYKSVYPAGRTAVEERHPNSKTPDVLANAPEKHLRPCDKQAVVSVLEAFGQHKPVLLEGEAREAVYASLVRRTIADGKDALLLRPGVSKPGYVCLRELSRAVRGASPTLIEGHRSLLFLPWRKLGLIIVDEEQDSAYKQDSAPRYNARDAAVALGALHGANVLLGSSSPSLESSFNVTAGRFSAVQGAGEEAPGAAPLLIDATAERRKNGLRGSLSLKLLDALAEEKNAGGRVLILFPWADWRDIEIELREAFPDNRFRYARISKVSRTEIAKARTVVVMCADALLGRGDFRSDERAYSALLSVRRSCTGQFIIHGRDLQRPVFQALASDGKDFRTALLAERKEFGYPPFSRLVELRIVDDNEPRKAKMTSELAKKMGGLQFMLPKDRSLASSKKKIADGVAAFEKQFRYTGHIIIDVDP